MSKWSERDSILARHAGHQLVGVDARTVKCLECNHTLLLDANRTAVDGPPPATSSTTQPRRDEPAVTPLQRTLELRAQHQAALAAAAAPDRVHDYAAQIREQLAARRRTEGATA